MRLTFLSAHRYVRALLPSGSSSDVDVRDTGITKVGARGEFILAIGVEEQLLPGKTVSFFLCK